MLVRISASKRHQFNRFDSVALLHSHMVPVRGREGGRQGWKHIEMAATCTLHVGFNVYVARWLQRVRYSQCQPSTCSAINLCVLMV